MKNEKGFSLIEVLVSLAVISIIVAGFLSALSTTFLSLNISNERTTSESLARSQMEYVKNQPYDTAGDYILIDTPSSYEVAILTSDLELDMQKITVTVNHLDGEVITLEGYRGNR